MALKLSLTSYPLPRGEESVHRILKALVLVVSLSVFARAAAYAECCGGCGVPADKKAQYDALVQMSDARKQHAETLHFPWGLPKAT